MKNLLLVLVLALTFTACKKANVDTPNPTPAPTAETYTERCGLVLSCDTALPISHPPYYKLQVRFTSNGPIETRYANRPYVKGSTFCYFQPNWLPVSWVSKPTAEICGNVAGYMPVGAIGYGWNVIVNYPQLGTKKVYYTQAYYPLGATFCANP